MKSRTSWNSPWGRAMAVLPCSKIVSSLPINCWNAFSTLLWNIAIFCESHWVPRHALVKIRRQRCVMTAQCMDGWVSDVLGKMIPSHSFFLERSWVRLLSSYHMISAMLRKLIGKSRKLDEFGIWRTSFRRWGKLRGWLPSQERRPANLTGVYLDPKVLGDGKGC